MPKENSFLVGISELHEIRAFQQMSAEQLTLLASMMLRQNYSPGQIIFIEGDQSTSLWFVAKGRVKIIKQSLNGRVQGLCLMNKGKCFGTCPLFSMEENPATAQALDQVTLFILPQDAFLQLRQREPTLVKALLHIYSQRLEHLAHVSEILGTWTVADRINESLLAYAHIIDGLMSVDLTHEKLASLSGTVREVVTRHLSRLEKEGALYSETGRIVITNPDVLIPSYSCGAAT